MAESAVDRRHAPFHVLGRSGSLRAASSNTAMLTLACDNTPPGITMSLYRQMGELPLFNPDLDENKVAAVVRFQQAIARAHAVLIASPEYALGISGAMKNALDWIVASGVLVDKPMALWNAARRASHGKEIPWKTRETSRIRSDMPVF